MHRVLFAIHRKPDLTYEEFLAHYRDVHLPIAKRLPKLRRYEIFPVQPGADADANAPDAFALMFFDSAEDFEWLLTTPEMAAAVEDNQTFIDRFELYTVDHLPVISD
jgi:uncharacterized protein (TIGR02118 family)